jgi:predicted transglutaminase-like cysteine proteinase
MNDLVRIASIAVALIAASAQLVQAASPALFGTLEWRNDSLDALPQWQETLERIENETGSYQDCARNSRRCNSRGLALWQTMMHHQTGKSRIRQVQAVNSFVNQWIYRADSQNYGKSDYWATPTEFFKRSGDCEDYAIAKYVSLRHLNFRADELRLVVVKDMARNLAHAVLAVYVEGTVFILDNLSNQAMPQEQITSYAPYYSVNETARWMHVPVKTLATTQAKSSRPVTRLALSDMPAKS